MENIYSVQISVSVLVSSLFAKLENWLSEESFRGFNIGFKIVLRIIIRRLVFEILINKEIVVEKLFNYGIRGTFLSWKFSFLRRRKLFVKVNKVNGVHNVDISVPKDSV